MTQIHDEKIAKEIFIECRPETLFSFSFSLHAPDSTIG